MLQLDPLQECSIECTVGNGTAQGASANGEGYRQYLSDIDGDLAKAVSSNPATTGGMFEYFTDATLSNASKVADPATVGSGTFYVVEKTASGCMSLPLMVHVQITTCSEQTPCNAANPATASAGVDANVCAAKTYQLSGAMGGAGKTAHWTTSGKGTFDNSFALKAIYTASAEDYCRVR